MTGDWTFWGSGAVLAIGALWLLYWSLLADRPKGRQRCPKCWYDMASQAQVGVLVCPECGHDAERLKRLGKTRRWLWRALLSLLLLVVAAGVSAIPSVRERGWEQLSPTTVLIFLIPTIDDKKGPMVAELRQRLSVEEWAWSSGEPNLGLWSWQRALLAARCAQALGESSTSPACEFSLTMLRGLGPDAEPAVDSLLTLMQSDRNSAFRVLRVLEAIGPGAESSVPTLVQMLEVVDPDRDYHAILIIQTLANIGPASQSSVPALHQIVESGPGESGPSDRFMRSVCYEEAIRALGRIGRQARVALPTLNRIVCDSTAHHRIEAMTAIGRIDAASPVCREGIFVAIRDAEIGLRDAAVGAMLNQPPLVEETVEGLVASLQSDDTSDRIDAARGLMTLGPVADASAPALCEAVGDQDPIVRLFAIEALTSMRSVATQAMVEIRAAADDPDASVQRAARKALTTIAKLKEDS